MLVALVTLQLLNHPPGQQLHIGVAPGEVQVLAAIHNGRAGRAHVDLFRTGLIEEVHRFPELGAPDDGIVHKQQLFPLNQLGNGDLLHFGHLVADLLVGRGEGPGPGGGVLYKGAGKGFAAAVGEADGVGDAGIRHTRHIVHFGEPALGHLVASHDLAVAIAHDLHIDALVIGVGVAVIGPEKAADLHFLTRRRDGLIAVPGQGHDLTGT